MGRPSLVVIGVGALAACLIWGCKSEPAATRAEPAQAEPAKPAAPVAAASPTPAGRASPFAGAATTAPSTPGEPAKYAGRDPAAQGSCEAACRHLAECGVSDYNECLPACGSASAAEIAAIAAAPCDQLRGEGAPADDDPPEVTGAEPARGPGGAGDKCQQACRHIVECGTNTMEGCTQLCGNVSAEQLDREIRATCDELRAASQPAAGGGGGTSADCAAVGGSLGGEVCAETFACRKQGCPVGWSCGVEGMCHNDQFPNCKRCP